MRLIDKDEVIYRIEENIQAYYEENSFGYYLAEAVIDELNVMPTIDIKPVKHGHWVEYPKPHYFKCSECEYIVPYRKAVSVNGAREYDYFPSCGAIMDLEG